jgi:hypothetical protein
MSGFVSKCVSSLLILSWVFLFIVVEPAHHHDDHESHHDCGICLIAGQPIEFVIHFVLPTAENFSCESIVISQNPYASKCPVLYTSRSPPSFLSA